MKFRLFYIATSRLVSCAACIYSAKGGGRARRRFSCCRTMQPTYYCMVIHCIILRGPPLSRTYKSRSARLFCSKFCNIAPRALLHWMRLPDISPAGNTSRMNETPALLDTEEDNECSRFIADKIYTHFVPPALNIPERHDSATRRTFCTLCGPRKRSESAMEIRINFVKAPSAGEWMKGAAAEVGS